MALKHVEKIRPAIIRQQVTALGRLRFYLSTIGENQAAVDVLRGEPGEIVLARIVDLILRELGHDATPFSTRSQQGGPPVEAKASHVRREIARVRGKSTSEDDVEA